MFKLRVLLGGVALFAVGHIADAAPQDVDPLVQQIMSSPPAKAKAQNEGRKVAAFCANCHGDSGNSVYEYIPNLAGQHPAYLLSQIRKFADGRRQDDFMSGMIKAMKEEDRVDVAFFYANQSVRPSATGSNAQVVHGASIFRSICSGCHGQQGYGNERTARLAGQHATYISQSLQKYRKGEGDRSDPVMGSVARRLNDADTADVAAYISTMR